MKNLTFLLLFMLFAKISFSQKTTVGAIRWDAWTGSSNSVGRQVEVSLGPNQYHYRVPFYGKEISADSVNINACTQQIMDKEITYAANAGLDYWAFLWYPSASGLDQSRQLYQTSTLKQSIKYCLIVEAYNFNTNISIDNMVTEFSNPTYQKVLTNRPLLYLLGYSGIQKSDVDSLRARTVRAGLGTPYIVEMRVDGVYTILATLGLDAFSMYATAWIGGGVQYDSLAKSDRGQWDWIGINNALPTVPHVTTGWDNRPRHDHLNNWQPDPGPDAWVQRPTAAQLSGHVAEAIAWNSAHPTVATANTVIVYAWNEFDEGGWLCPTITPGNDSVPVTTILDSLTKVLKAPATSPNLALRKTYTSSSNWDNSQKAAKAFDGNSSTNWQAQSGSNFGSQWLQVYFGSSTTFNKVVLSEYGNRTAGFRIEYSNNGFSWQTAYTGTTIGSKKTITFNTVTGKYARIRFTSGSFTPIIFEFEIYNVAVARIATVQPMFTGINKNEFNIYPNPTNNNITLTYNLTNESAVNIVICNTMGTIVKQFDLKTQLKGIHKYAANLNDLSAGYYLVKLRYNGFTETKPMLIMK